MKEIRLGPSIFLPANTASVSWFTASRCCRSSRLLTLNAAIKLLLVFLLFTVEHTVAFLPLPRQLVRSTSPTCACASVSSPSSCLFSQDTRRESSGEAADALPDNVHNKLDEILKVAMEASAKAANIIAENSEGTAVVETKSTCRDLLTLIDPQCEQAIRETVLAAFPDHSILGEEGVEPGIEAAKAALEEKIGSEFLWIVDPVDGTTNLASGIPFNTPSVAVAYHGELIVGVVHDPHRNEVWTAVKGRGAFLNGERIHVAAGETTSIEDAVIGAESPAGQKSLEVAMKGINVLMPKCRTIRILGSTAVKLPWVAKGRLTCYWSPDECAWDHAAGAIIVQEAGGIITDLDGSPFTLRTRKFLASPNKVVHKQVLQVLKDEAGIY